MSTDNSLKATYRLTDRQSLQVKQLRWRLTVLIASLPLMACVATLLFVDNTDDHSVLLNSPFQILLLLLFFLLLALLLATASYSIAKYATNVVNETLALQQSFVDNASHELNTPLTILQSRIDLLQAKYTKALSCRVAFNCVGKIKSFFKVLLSASQFALQSSRSNSLAPTALLGDKRLLVIESAINHRHSLR